jgi:hypothetical protein
MSPPLSLVTRTHIYQVGDKDLKTAYDEIMSTVDGDEVGVFFVCCITQDDITIYNLHAA